jgi:hypothetical protein
LKWAAFHALAGLRACIASRTISLVHSGNYQTRVLQVEAEGEVATAFTLARMLSNIPLTRGGPASIVIFDIHALQARARSPCCVQALLPLADYALQQPPSDGKHTTRLFGYSLWSMPSAL